MAKSKHFEQLVKSGNPVGEIIGVDRFLVRVKGLHPVSLRGVVVFEDGSRALVHRVLPDHVILLHLGTTSLTIGMMAVVQDQLLTCRVGKEFVGRVISANGEALDQKGVVAADANWPVFNGAPKLNERAMLDTQLETGVTVIDSLFPLVRGQRIALMGDSKAGKSTLAAQLALHQKNTDVIVVYVLISKRPSEIDQLISRLQASDSLKNAVVVVSTMFDSPVVSYLAPYIGCAIAEYLWQTMGQEVLIIYDDLTTHSFVYREIALLSGAAPGRDSYPGDMFHAHSSLLERAGKLKKTNKSLTCLPVVLTPGGDITSYLATNIMSITDGQWVLDTKVFNQGVRPGLNTGLSVTRVGGRGHNARQKQLALASMKTLGAYVQAQEFAHFGSELALSTRADVERGELLRKTLTQAPENTFSVMEQQLMLDVVLSAPENQSINIDNLKKTVKEHANKIQKDEDYNKVRDLVRAQAAVELKR